MCLAMYLFTDDTIEEKEWDEKNPRMYIKEMKLETCCDFENNVFKWNENNKKIYYIGSYEGCGCGWHSTKNNYGNRDTEEDRQILYNKIIDRRNLYKLLKSIKHNGSYIIVCWEGDQGNELIETIKLNIEKIKKTNYEYYELVKYILINNIKL
jgi:hypothetical protein